MRLPRFLLFGGLCAALNNALVIGLVWAGFHPLAASLLAFLPVLAVGFALHSLLTFETAMSPAAFLRYALAMATNFPAWSASLFILSDLLGAPIAFAAPATTVLLVAWNFLFARWALARFPLERNRSRIKKSRQNEEAGANSDRESLSTFAEFALTKNPQALADPLSPEKSR